MLAGSLFQCIIDWIVFDTTRPPIPTSEDFHGFWTSIFYKFRCYFITKSLWDAKIIPETRANHVPNIFEARLLTPKTQKVTTKSHCILFFWRTRYAIRKPPPLFPPKFKKGGGLSYGQNFVSFFLVRIWWPRSGKFWGFAFRFDEFLKENGVSDVHNPQNFPPAAGNHLNTSILVLYNSNVY